MAARNPHERHAAPAAHARRLALFNLPRRPWLDAGDLRERISSSKSRACIPMRVVMWSVSRNSTPHIKR